MSAKRSVALAGLLSALATAAPAQEPPAPETVRLSLGEAVAKAKEWSARLAQLRSLETAAAEGLRAARAGRRPLLDLSASYSRNANVPELILEFPGQPPRTLFPNIPGNYRTRAALTLPVWTGGRVEGAIEAAGLAREAASRDVDAGRADLVLETTAAYWGLVTARQAERVLREAVASYEGHFRDSRNRLDSGLAARDEVLAVQVEKDRAELTRLRAFNAAEIASADLTRLTGVPLGARIEAVDPLAGGEPGQEAPEALATAALAGRPEVAALRSRIASLESSARVAQAATRPQLGLTAAYDFARPNTRILPLADEWKGTWSLGVGLSLSLDGGRTTAAVAQVRAQAEAVRYQLQEVERGVRLEVTSRLLDLKAAREALGVADRNLEAATENLRVSQDRFTEGVIPSSERLDAETNLLRAGLDRTEAAAQWRLALARLDRAVGR